MALDPALLKKIEQGLTAQKTKLEEDLARIATKKSEKKYETQFPELGSDETDNASEVALYSANLSIKKTMESTLKDVLATLERIKKGTYGICKYCKKVIDEKRLIARPFSSACVACKKKFTNEE